MKPERQALMVGALAGGATFVAFLAGWLKTNMDEIQGGSEQFAEQVAEQAAKQYLANRFGLTEERLAQLRTTVERVRAMTGGR